MKFACALMMCVFVAMSSASAAADDPGLYFDKAPFVTPRIIEDLGTWLSDGGDQVVAINLTDSQGSNRYCGDFEVRTSKQPHPFVVFEAKEGDPCSQSPNAMAGWFGYTWIGRTPDGVIVLQTESGGAGTGVFPTLLFVTVERDRGYDWSEGDAVVRASRERWLVRKLGEIPLGDRYEGEITLDGSTLHIGKDTGRMQVGTFPEDRAIELERLPRD